MKPRTPAGSNLQLVLELREALALIHDFCLEQSAMTDSLLERLNEQILKMDRRYGDIQRYNGSKQG